ncbi:MAG: nicotinate-nucleotide adenylyltransferase [Acidobacteriota bacterium]|nr:nicotinate-nucleotide adenylyltransferase [Acidobacteriota bacterium]
MKPLRIGIFGGSFDPVHQGHMEVAVAVCNRLSLDRVEFVPAFRAPHKKSAATASHWHRFAMLVLATTAHEKFFVSPIELELSRPAYTIETIQRFKQQWPDQTEFYFILGADSLAEITSWKDYETLLSSCHFVAVNRPGHDLSVNHLPESAHRRVIDLRVSSLPATSPHEPVIYLCTDVANPISSTDIRRALKEGKRVEAIPPMVWQHIEKYQLYQGTDETTE